MLLIYCYFDHHYFVLKAITQYITFFFLQFQAKYKEKQEVFGQMKSLPYDVYEEVYNETGLDLGNRFEKMGVIANSMEKNIRNMVDFVRLIPGFLELSTKDQLSLIKCKYIAI